MGAAGRAVLSVYLQILWVTQILLNDVTTELAAYKTASNLQSLMAETSVFLDLLFITGFHEAYFQKHFEWKDLSNLCGFQSHQMLPRYFLMVKDLNEIKDTMLGTHPAFHSFRTCMESRERYLDGWTTSSVQTKAEIFVDLALKSLHKHFRRWGLPQYGLLPAALLSETPLSECVVNAMTMGPPAAIVDNPNEVPFVPEVHRVSFMVSEYQSFVDELVKGEDDTILEPGQHHYVRSHGGSGSRVHA